jgi:predicted nucleic acid-binding protein
VDSAYVLDSYALFAHFEAEVGGETVSRILKAAQAGKTKLFLSVINFGELYYMTLRERGREQAEEVRIITEQLPVTILNVDMALTLEAARLKAGHALAYADCFAAALGIQKKAKVITGDPEFKKFGDDVDIEWLK